MKFKFTKCIFMIITLLQITNYSQELTQEQKDHIISKLSTTDSWAAINDVIEYKIYEAVETIENNIWKQGRLEQERFLKALLILGSSKTHELTLAYIDTLNTNPIGTDELECDVLLQKVRATDILIDLGDYSTVEYVFELIKREPDPPFIAIITLPKIIDKVPSYAERAKEELIRISKESSSSSNRWFAITNLIKRYDGEMLSLMKQMFKEDSSSGNRHALLIYYLLDYDIKDFLKEQLYKDSSGEIRYQIVKDLLYYYGTPEDYNFVKNYIKNDEKESLYERVIKYNIKNYQPPSPDTTLPAQTMLDTLTSYTNQCYGYEWLKDEAYKNELLNKLTNAKDNLTTGDSLGCRREVEAFQNSVNQVYQDSAGSYPKYVSEEGYKFLYYYAGYILDRLPKESFPPNDIDAKAKTKK